MKDFIAKHKITAGLIGGSLAIGTAYGSCVLSPPGATESTEEPAEVEAPPVEEAPAPEATEGE